MFDSMRPRFFEIPFWKVPGAQVVLPWTAFFLIAPFAYKHYWHINLMVEGLMILFPLFVLVLFWYHQAFRPKDQTERMNAIGRTATIALAVYALVLTGAAFLTRNL